MRKPPKSITILVDSREQYPILFPSSITWYPYRTTHESYLMQVRPRVATMETGDYALEGWEDRCLIERKGSFSEVSANMLSKDYARSHSALGRLVGACQYPYLLLEESIAGMFPAPSARNKYVGDPELVFDMLLAELNGLGIQLIWTGKGRSATHRRKLGTIVAHILANHAFREDPGKVRKLRGFSLTTPKT